MAVDPQLQAMLDAMRMAGFPKVGTISAAEMRVLAHLPMPPATDVWSVGETIIPGPAGDIGARIYRPSEETGGLILFYHGGGWTLGDLDSHDGTVRLIANATNCTIVSVDYRLAPENPFPAAVEDAWAAVQWADTQRHALTGTPSAPLIVMGDSAGGNLSAVVAILARDAEGPEIALQVLIYPATEGDVDADSMYRFESPFLDRGEIEWFYDQYIGKDQRHDFRFAPGRAADHSGLPRAFILTAEHDLLAEEAALYAEKLKAAGNSVIHVHYEGAIHGFVTMPPIAEPSRRALADIAEQVRAITGNNGPPLGRTDVIYNGS